jgi:hypothetical protein
VVVGKCEARHCGRVVTAEKRHWVVNRLECLVDVAD